MASGDVLVPIPNPGFANSPPASNAAVPDQVGTVWGLSYAQSTDGIFPFFLPNHYSAGGIDVTIVFEAPSGGPTSGNVAFQAQFKRIQNTTTDLTSLTFATAQLFTVTAVQGSVGVVTYLTKSFTNGQIDGLLKNEFGLLKLTRNTTNDTATGGTAKIVISQIVLRET